MKIMSVIMLLCMPLVSYAACTIVVTNIAFGAYVPSSAIALDGTGNIAVGCDGVAGQAISYTLSINAGSSGAFVSRKMTYPPYALNYNVYLDAARTTIWGDGNVASGMMADAYASSAGMNTRNYTIYGRIPALQSVPPGTYNDSLVATLIY